MKILLTAATTNEIALFAPPDNTDILITGVGIPATVYHLQKRFHQMDYDFVIQAGLAGSYNRNIALGETVVVEKDAFGDIGMEENNFFQPLFETFLTDKNEFPFTNGWLENKNEWLQKLSYQKTKAITVNTVSDNEQVKKYRETNFTPDIETMEGAAFQYVCIQEQISFLQIRTISNKAGVRDKSKWMIEESLINLNKELTKLINKLIN